MLYFSVDPRDGGPKAAAGSCNTCCCESFQLRPGETNMLKIDYSPWSLAVSPPGIVPLFTYSIEASCDACPDEIVSNTNYSFAAPTGVVGFSVATNAASTVSTTFTYEIVALSGPTHGQITQDATLPGTFEYTPNGGYTGYDYFSYTTTDDQGNSITRHVQINVGGATGAGSIERMALVPYIFKDTIVTDQSMQTVDIPIYMPLSARDCETFRLTIKQPARNCDCQMFHHMSCYDIRTIC